MIDKIIFYDADFLICFLIIGEVFILKKVFNEIIIPKQVYDELTDNFAPKVIRETIVDLKESGFVKVFRIGPNSKERIPYLSIKRGDWHNYYKKLGKGESAALAFAIENNGVIASNNFADIKYYVDKYGLPLITTSYFLALLVDEKIMDYDEVFAIYDRMIEKGRKMPCANFDEYYNYLFKEDSKDFGFRLWE